MHKTNSTTGGEQAVTLSSFGFVSCGSGNFVSCGNCACGNGLLKYCYKSLKSPGKESPWIKGHQSCMNHDLACTQRQYPCNTSGFRRQCCLSLQGTHLPIYAYLLWFLVSFAKLRRSGPVWNFLPFPPPLWRHVHLSPISVLSPSASAKSCFLWLSIAKVVSGCIDSENDRQCTPYSKIATILVFFLAN